MSETQHILTPIKFGLLGFAISIYVKGLLKSGILRTNQMVLELHRSTQPTEIYLIASLPDLNSLTGSQRYNPLNLQGIAARGKHDQHR